MLKLLKYNWKMNSLSLYIVLVSSVLLYALLVIGKYKWGWMDELVFVGGVVVSSLSSLILLVMTSLSYKHQLSSYHRRLLPLSQLEEIASILLLGVVYMLLAATLMFAFFAVLDVNFNSAEVNKAMEILLQPKPLISSILFALWNTITLLALIMLSMATTYSFRGKYRAWIGVIVFIGFSLAVDYITNLVVGPSYDQYFAFIKFGSYEADISLSESLPVNWFHFWSVPMLIAALALVLKLAVTHYLMKKRIQL